MKTIKLKFFSLLFVLFITISAHAANMRIHLRTNNGNYLQALNGGGGEVNAKGSEARQWETFMLIDINGGKDVLSGEKVYLKAYDNQHFLCAENGGGSKIVADKIHAKKWETFVIHKIGGEGFIRDGDSVAFEVLNGNYMTAEGGGGEAVNANGPWARSWETFILEQYASDILENEYFLIISKNSSKCLDVERYTYDNGGNIHQWSAHGMGNQLWELKKNRDDYYQIINRRSGKCLDVTWYDSQDGTNIQQWQCHGGDNQLWSIERLDNNFFRVMNKASGKCLDVSNYSIQDGANANVHQWQWHGGDNQQWKFQRTRVSKELKAHPVIPESIDLLVLCHEDFEDALYPLKAHKEGIGIKTHIMSWQALIQDFRGRDAAERIKRGIAELTKSAGVNWVMLVGDVDRFPVRYSMNDRQVEAAYNRSYGATDLYYADLFEADGKSFESWDSNENGFYGEQQCESSTGKLNLDEVDLYPDVAVGRIPASTESEVIKYVEKIIRYEHAIGLSDWHWKALLIASHDYVSDNFSCDALDDIANNSLSDYSVLKLYTSGTTCNAIGTPDPTTINNIINEGVRFVIYSGHGSLDRWAIPENGSYGINDLDGLYNRDKLPIVFASACSTAGFSSGMPYKQYTDIYGDDHIGTEAGEYFYSIPQPPSTIQTWIDPECLAEQMLLRGDYGAIAYIGCITGAQNTAVELAKKFFETLNFKPETIGDMWRYMIEAYYNEHDVDPYLSNVDWTKGADFSQPWKFPLFGDPSLRLSGN